MAASLTSPTCWAVPDCDWSSLLSFSCYRRSRHRLASTPYANDVSVCASSRLRLWPIHNDTQRGVYPVEMGPSWAFCYISQCWIRTGITATAVASSLLDFVVAASHIHAPPSRLPESVDILSLNKSTTTRCWQQIVHTRRPDLATVI